MECQDAKDKAVCSSVVVQVVWSSYQEPKQLAIVIRSSFLASFPPTPHKCLCYHPYNKAFQGLINKHRAGTVAERGRRELCDVRRVCNCDL